MSLSKPSIDKIIIIYSRQMREIVVFSFMPLLICLLKDTSQKFWDCNNACYCMSNCTARTNYYRFCRILRNYDLNIHFVDNNMALVRFKTWFYKFLKFAWMVTDFLKKFLIHFKKTPEELWMLLYVHSCSHSLTS